MNKIRWITNWLFVLGSKDRVPFAVVGSNAVVEIANGNGGRKIRVRKYPWGIVEVENDAHSDFVTLRNILIRLAS